MTHELHFMVEQRLYNNLVQISRLQRISISGLIVTIFNTLDTFLEKNMLKSNDRMCRYSKIDEDSNQRRHIHCYIPESQYRKLKKIYETLNFYSIAQIVRELIRSFVRAVFKYGFDVLINKLYHIKRIWNRMKENYKKEKRVFVRQVSTDFTKFQITYTPESVPASITLIE